MQYTSTVIKSQRMERDSQEHTYALNSKVSCNKHPAKHIEFFCKHPDCVQKLFCSNCILKKQICSHEAYIVDISQYLHEQKLFYQSKGLSTNSEYYQFSKNLSSSRKQYQFMIENEFTKFSDEVDRLVEETIRVINDMRVRVKAQLDSYVQSHHRSEINFEKRLNESFATTFYSKYDTYAQIFRTNSHSTTQALKQLLTNLNMPLKLGYYEGPQEQLNNLITLQAQSPQIDYTQYQNIRNNLKIFQHKLSQIAGSIISLKSPLQSSRTKWISSFQVKKMEVSRHFSSYLTSPISALGIIGNILFIGGENGEIRVFDSNSFECLTAFKAHDQCINSITSYNKNLVTASEDRTIKVWNFSQPIKLKQMNYIPDVTLTGHTLGVLAVKHISQQLMVSGGADLTLRLWDLKDNSSKSFSAHLNDVLCLTSNNQGNSVISGSADKTIKLWRVEKRLALVCEKTLSGHHDSVTNVILLQDEDILFSGSLDKCIRVWSIYKGECTKVIPSQHLGYFRKLEEFTNNLLVSSSTDGVLRFWDSDSYNCIHSIETKSGRVSLVVEKRVFVGGEDRMIYVCQ